MWTTAEVREVLEDYSERGYVALSRIDNCWWAIFGTGGTYAQYSSLADKVGDLREYVGLDRGNH